MKILIVGGGIGGCVLAFFLAKHGFSPIVIEKSERFSRIGYLLALRETGLSILRKMGVLEEVAKYEITFKKSIWFDIYGKLIKSFAVDSIQSKYAGMALNRADLHACLLESVKDKVPFHTGREVTAMHQTNDGVSVVFSDGRKERFDIVVGADGFHSQVRNLVFGTDFTKYLGSAFFAFILPNRTKTAITKHNEAHNVRGPDFFISYGMFSRDEREVGSYVIYQEKDYTYIPKENRRQYLIDHFGKYDRTFLHILETMEEGNFIYHGDLSQVVMPTWSKGRVCLIGDASYCLTLASGLGASMAMAGAYILAKELSETKDYRRREAFASYEQKLRPEIERLQAFGQQMAKFIVGESIVPYRIMNLLLSFAPQQLTTKILLRSSDRAIGLE